MKIIKELTNNKFLNLKQVKDPDKGVNGYLFAERRGIDSVAFICWDVDKNAFLLNDEYKPPIDEFVLGAFGGSLDKDVTPRQIVKEEVKEEAGFQVENNDIFYLGRAFVSTQMNQFCHLFLVKVDKEKEGAREPENAIEEQAKTIWIKLNEIYELQDWKAIMIISLAKNEGLIK